LEALNVVVDYPLMTALLHNDKKFVEQHPDIVMVFKKFLDKVAGMAPPQGPRQRHNVRSTAPPRAVDANAPGITQDMLSQALAAVFQGTAGAGTSASATDTSQNAPANVPPTINYEELRQKYASQLETMREFGFTNDEENLRALQACEGEVERALELVISFRED
jgi:hypothetical protein